MAMITPKLSFFLDPCFLGNSGGGGENVGDGDGEGEGEGEQACRGGPHKSEFPIKDELGNL